MAQFHIFSQLCQELQDEIWDRAIRDDEPSAQFFTIYNGQVAVEDPAAGPKERTGGMKPICGQYSVCVAAPRPSIFNQSSVGLAAPRAIGPKQSTQSWVDGNNSAYMTDSGLWTACRGSRKRMLWRFKPAKTSALMSRLKPVGFHEAQEICRRPTASVTMPFQRDNGERQYLTIKPMEDLLYFQYNHIDARSAEFSPRQKYWKCLQDFPPFIWQRPGDGGGWHSPLHIRHMAIEYDPAWLYPEDHISPQFGHVAGLENFWLVDRTLQRRYRVDDESDRRGRQTFRAGDDHELVEVLKTDEEWWDLSPHSDDKDSQGKSFAHEAARDMEADAYIWSMIAQMNALNAEREAQQGNIANDHGNTPGDDRAAPPKPSKCGVLAYVKRGSERDLPTRNELLHSQEVLDRAAAVGTGSEWS